MIDININHSKIFFFLTAINMFKTVMINDIAVVASDDAVEDQM